MTEPSDEQIIADAMLLGAEFIVYGDKTTSCGIAPYGTSLPWKNRAMAARWALQYAGYTYVGTTLTKLR